MDISAISAAVTSLKTAKDIAQGLLALKSLSEVQGKVIELQSAILDAQGKALDAQAGLVELQDQLKAANQRIAELNNHQAFVRTLSRSNGAYLAPGDADPYCPRCIEVSVTPVHLVDTGKIEMRHRIWACPACKTSMPWRKGEP